MTNLRTFVGIAAIVLVAQVIVAIAGLAMVPAGTDVPIHWGPDGQPNGFAAPVVAFFLVPAITLGLVALLAVIPRIEPRREHLEASAGSYLTVAVALVLFMGVLQLVVVGAAVAHVQIPINAVIGVGTGVLFIVIGRAMRHVRSNFLFGVRTPWTLTSELSWRKTHEVVGWLFVVLGVAIIVVSVLAPPEAMVWVILAGVIAILVVAFGYSYVVWRDDPDRRTGP